MVATGSQELVNVCSEQRGHAVHLRVSGELDLSTTPVLELSLQEAESNGNTTIVLDLELVTFMDTSAIHSFLRAAARASRSGRDLSIVKAPPMVRRMLQITRTAHLLGSDMPSHPGASERQMIAAHR